MGKVGICVVVAANGLVSFVKASARFVVLFEVEAEEVRHRHP